VPKPEAGERKIELQGGITHILTLASANRKPTALGDGLVERFKLVAGVRNRHNLLFGASALGMAERCNP
jgi:hypothetical protein